MMVAATYLHALTPVSTSPEQVDTPVTVITRNTVYLESKARNSSGVNDIFGSKDPVHRKKDREINTASETQPT